MHEVVVRLLLERHAGYDADAEAEAHISLDHVGVARRQHDVGHQAGLGEDPERRRAGEPEDVGDDRIAASCCRVRSFFERASGWFAAPRRGGASGKAGKPPQPSGQ